MYCRVTVYSMDWKSEEKADDKTDLKHIRREMLLPVILLGPKSKTRRIMLRGRIRKDTFRVCTSNGVKLCYKTV